MLLCRPHRPEGAVQLLFRGDQALPETAAAWAAGERGRRGEASQHRRHFLLLQRRSGPPAGAQPRPRRHQRTGNRPSRHRHSSCRRWCPCSRASPLLPVRWLPPLRKRFLRSPFPATLCHPRLLCLQEASHETASAATANTTSASSSSAGINSSGSGDSGRGGGQPSSDGLGSAWALQPFGLVSQPFVHAAIMRCCTLRFFRRLPLLESACTPLLQLALQQLACSV